MNKMKIFVVAVGLVLIAAGCNKNTPASNNANTPTPPPAQTPSKPEPVTIQLAAENNSKEAGTATLTAVDDKTQVKIDLTNAPAAAQPAHIHLGACPLPEAVKYPLNNVVAGHSTTVIDVALSDLLTQLPLAINVHKSATESNVYVSCGDITAQTAAAQTVTVEMSANGFSPATITIKAGTTVLFKTTDNSTHWPASNPHPTHTDLPGLDALKAIAQGGTYSYTFTKVGTWGYHDHLHTTLHGTVIVTP